MDEEKDPTPAASDTSQPQTAAPDEGSGPANNLSTPARPYFPPLDMTNRLQTALTIPFLKGDE